MNKELRKKIIKNLEELQNNAHDYDWEEINNMAYEIEECLIILETPPTADEVCKALSEYTDAFVSFCGEEFEVSYEPYQSQSICYREKDNLHFGIQLPPYLITMIGRFYEAQIIE